ncbi:MAG TPA: chromate transporter [Stellaceae bacterium]|nr:chromate transporter [Stellaceae bacterium]
MSDSAPLGALAWQFAILSLVAVGGANSVIPEMQRQVVDVHGWMSSTDFADLYALARAAPGPNVLVVSLIGWHVAGLAGALVAMGAMCGPSSVLAYGTMWVWDRFRTAPWRIAVQAGLVPVTVGLVLASGYLLTRAADPDWPSYALTAITAGVALKTRTNPLWLLLAAGALGLVFA